MSPSPSTSWARRMGDLVRDMRGEGRTGPCLGGRVRDSRPPTPAPGSPYMMPRAPPTHWLWWDRLGIGFGVVIGWKEDHVIARAKRHELQTPEHHDGAEAEWAKFVCHLGFPQRGEESTMQKAPTWCTNCRCLDSSFRH